MAALIVKKCVRPDSDTAVFPAHQISGDGVIPVFQTVYGAPGAPLVKEMPFPFVKGKTVRVAGKAGDRLHMVSLAVERALNAVVQVPDIFRSFQDAVTFLKCPLSHGDTSVFIALRLSRLPFIHSAEITGFAR